jgi:hypothetical protein
MINDQLTTFLQQVRLVENPRSFQILGIHENDAAVGGAHGEHRNQWTTQNGLGEERQLPP